MSDTKMFPKKVVRKESQTGEGINFKTVFFIINVE